MVKLLNEFYEKAAFLGGFTTAFVTLITKVDCPQERNDFRPISLIFKADFQKAYDSISWNFLLYMMRRMGFSDRWRRWMATCVCAGSFSVLVNGSPTNLIHMPKGLRQGDPFAPFLFIIAVEGLKGLMDNVVDQGKFQPMEVGQEHVEIALSPYNGVIR
jgi:hypothetical protein